MLVAKFDGLSRSCVTLTKGIQYDPEGWTSTVALNAKVLVQRNELSRLQLSHNRNKKSGLHCMRGRAQAPGGWYLFALSSCSPQLLTDASENASEISRAKKIYFPTCRTWTPQICLSQCMPEFVFPGETSPFWHARMQTCVRNQAFLGNRLWQPTACCSMIV